MRSLLFRNILIQMDLKHSIQEEKFSALKLTL